MKSWGKLSQETPRFQAFFWVQLAILKYQPQTGRFLGGGKPPWMIVSMVLEHIKFQMVSKSSNLMNSLVCVKFPVFCWFPKMFCFNHSCQPQGSGEQAVVTKSWRLIPWTALWGGLIVAKIAPQENMPIQLKEVVTTIWNWFTEISLMMMCYILISGETRIHVEINNNFNRLQSTLSQQQRVTYIYIYGISILSS